MLIQLIYNVEISNFYQTKKNDHLLKPLPVIKKLTRLFFRSSKKIPKKFYFTFGLFTPTTQKNWKNSKKF
jgi:hypothetical protein